MNSFKGAPALSLLLFFAFMSPLAHAAPASEVTISGVDDLRQEGAASREQQLPILLMFSADNCIYCMRMEEEFLKPMLRSGDYADKVIIRQLKVDRSTTLLDFDGQTVAADAFASRYRAFVTPTLVFLDHRGRELAERMVGLGTPDFFGGYLDSAIDDSLRRLRETSSVADAAQP